MLDRLLQRRSTPLGLRGQNARRGLCYAGKRGEIGGVIEPRIHLSQAADMSRKAGPPLSAERLQKIQSDCRAFIPSRTTRKSASSRAPLFALHLKHSA